MKRTSFTMFRIRYSKWFQLLFSISIIIKNSYFWISFTIKIKSFSYRNIALSTILIIKIVIIICYLVSVSYLICSINFFKSKITDISFLVASYHYIYAVAGNVLLAPFGPTYLFILFRI